MSKEENNLQYTKEVSTSTKGNEVVRYRTQKGFVGKANVPKAIKVALENFEVGTTVNAKGEVVVKDSDSEADPKAAAEAQKVANAQPSNSKELDKAKSDFDRDEAQDPVEPTYPEGEEPGGPQEPQQASLGVKIKNAKDVTDDGIDVEEQDRVARAVAGQEQDDEGMGFKRVNGKTVDIFDGKTPHTHIRLVAGITVPLSEKNFNDKTDGEIIDKLRKIGKIA